MEKIYFKMTPEGEVGCGERMFNIILDAYMRSGFIKKIVDSSCDILSKGCPQYVDSFFMETIIDKAAGRHVIIDIESFSSGTNFKIEGNKTAIELGFLMMCVESPDFGSLIMAVHEKSKGRDFSLN